jgi:hypothetical protein
VSAGGGAGRGGTALFASPGRVPRGVAFAPAVRGYPGGIADMAGDPDELVATEVGDGEPWAITGDAESGDPPDQAPPAGPVQPAQAESPQTPPEPAGPVSVWQQSAAAWQEAGIDWRRSPRAGVGPAGSSARAASARVRPVSSPPADDDPHTEPIPAVSADAPPGPAVRGGQEGSAGTAVPSGQEKPAGTAARAGGKPARRPRAGASARTDQIAASAVSAPGTAEAADTAGAAGGAPGAVPEDPAGKGRTAVQAGTVAGAASAAARGPSDDVTGAAGPATVDAAAAVGAASTDEPAADAGGVTAGKSAVRETGSGLAGSAGAPRRTRRGRRLAVVATAVVLLAGTFTAIGITRSGGTGPARPGFALITPYPPAAPADADFAGQVAGVTPLLPSLTGIAAAGRTVVAIGAQPSQPAPAPLMLLSTDGGHTWARATVAAPRAAGPGAPPPGAASGPGPGTGLSAGPGAAPGRGPAAGPGAASLAAVPAMIAHGGSTWLALGQHTAWTSPGGKAWQPAPAVPEAAGDQVLGLAGTGTGFVAVGEHAGRQPGPVVWTSIGGRAWQRKSGAALGLTARNGGHVAALRWVAAHGSLIVAGGQVTAAPRRRPAAGLWRSTDGGRTWDRVTLPATQGATSGLVGLATNGATFLAVRPGRTRAGHQYAVTYLSGQGSRWNYAGKLAPHRRTAMRVTAVGGSSRGFAVSAATRSGQVAFFRTRGHGWHRAAGPGSGVAGLTMGSDGSVVVAGNGHSGPGAAGIRPHLLLASAVKRQQVGQPVLTAAATPDTAVNALAAAGPTLVAAGAAGGTPALWLGSPGQWAPAGLRLPASWRGGALLSVVHGSSGWLTVGQAGTRAPYQPVILTSASGTSWTPAPGTGPLTAPGTSLVAAAAGPAGYVVVGGSTLADGSPAPAAWFSADLNTWARAPLTGAGGGGQMLAVTAARSGFVAAGAAGGWPAVWTSPGGSAWRLRILPRPAGAASAVLIKVAVIGSKVAAIGYEYRGTAAGPPVPFAAVSPDGGRTWRESVLPAPSGPAVVTTLTAAGHGFIVVGHPGLPGQPGLLAWWSADGLTWHHAGPSGGGVPGPFVTQINAVTAGNGTLTGAGFAASGSAEHPVLWHARYR